MEDDEKEFTLRFIRDYKNLPQLWDQNHKYYKNRMKRKEGLQILASKYGFNIEGVKKKIKNIRSYFCREHQKVIKNYKSGKSNYHSQWFAYNHLSFIMDFVTPRENSPLEAKDWQGGEIYGENSMNSQSPFISDDENDFIQPPVKKKRNMKNTQIGDDEEEVYSFMPKTNEELPESDECTLFGQIVAHKLRNLNLYNRILAQQRINNILYNLEKEQMVMKGK